MKRLIILLYICAGMMTSVYAQSFTMEYNVGFGTFGMSGMKDFLKQMNLTPPVNLKNTDNFGGHFVHEGKVGFLIKSHNMGFLFGYQNTAGQNHLADYSGEVKMRIRAAGYKLGGFYRYMLSEESKLTPFLEGSFGVVFNRVDALAYAKVGNMTEREEVKLTGTNMFLQPAVGLQYKFHRKLGVQATLGYEWDPVKGLHLKGDTTSPANYKADWNGIRINAGIIAFL